MRQNAITKKLPMNEKSRPSVHALSHVGSFIKFQFQGMIQRWTEEEKKDESP